MTLYTQQEFSVTGLSQLLKKTVEASFRNVRVRGEISAPKKHTSGHCYFTLKDDTTTMDAVCWRPIAQRFSHLFEEGAEVLCQGRLTTYPLRSKYQLVVESLSLTGEGALLKLFEQRKIKLQAEGLFNPETKKKIPFLPQVIGLITSPTGAVIRDVLHRLQDRLPRHVYLWPVNVQGSGAAEEVAQAIAGMNDWNNAWGPTPPDVLIVARGGGSLEDLAAFNEEIVVRAVHASRVPVISAIGHETDTTLIDYVADLRAPTPTAAAEFAVPVRENLLATLRSHANQQQNHLYRFLEHANLRLSVTTQKLLPQSLSIFQTSEQHFDEAQERLLRTMDPFFLMRRQRIQILAAALRTPESVFQCGHLQLQAAIQNLQRSWSQYVRQKTQTTHHTTQLLESLSYKKTLERGFCVVKSDSQFLTSAHQAQPQTPIQLNFHDGVVEGMTR